MSNFIQLENTVSWKDIIPKIEPNMVGLYLRDDLNYILGWGKGEELKNGSLLEIDQFLNDNKGKYIFGFLSYDIKNQIESFLVSNNPDKADLPESLLFTTKNTLVVSNGTVTYAGPLQKSELYSLSNKLNRTTDEVKKVNLQASLEKDEYIGKILKLKEHLQRGDIYEVNFCMNFFQNAEINPFSTFLKLNKMSTAPFSSYISFEEGAIISASPERFIQKRKSKLISQPIKGTAARDQNPQIDKLNADSLLRSDKEKAENVMIVDLVRNDLSKIASKSSVHVPELFGLYTFKTVHQLISTVECQTEENITFKDIMHATFPMGSMTGAPKISAMQIAEESESFKRGVYSGGLVLVHPNGNMDLNVVIRTILYNRENNHINAAVGSAITIKSDPEKEYEECLIKLSALQKALC